MSQRSDVHAYEMSNVHKTSTSLPYLREYELTSRSSMFINATDSAFMDEKRQDNANIAWESNCVASQPSGRGSTGTRQSVVVLSKQVVSSVGMAVDRPLDFVSAGERDLDDSSQLLCSYSSSYSTRLPNCDCLAETYNEPVIHTNDNSVTKSRQPSAKRNSNSPKAVLVKERVLQRTSVVSANRALENYGGEIIFPFGERSSEGFKESTENNISFERKTEDSEVEISPVRKRNSGGFPFREVGPTTIQNFPFQDEDHRLVEEIPISPSLYEDQRSYCDGLILSPNPFSPVFEHEIVPVIATGRELHAVAEEEIVPILVRTNQRVFLGIDEDKIIASETGITRGLIEKEDISDLLERSTDVVDIGEVSAFESGHKNNVSDEEDKTETTDSLQRSGSEESIESVNSTDDLPVDERIQDVNRAFEWVRAELLAMRAQDITLKLQFDSIRQEIRTMWDEQEEYYNDVIYDVIDEGEEIPDTLPAVTQEWTSSETCKALREDSGYHSDTPSQHASDSTGGLDAIARSQTPAHAHATYYYQPLPAYTKVQKMPARKARHSGKCVFEIVL